MPPKTQTKKALVEGLKTNCKRGYNLLAETQAELTATQKWILDKLMNELSVSGETYDELTRFLTDLNISIKVPMLTEMKPYTNKQGKTTMKHYTANGSMVNHLKDDKPVLYPTWTKFYRSKFQINEGGHFTSFADQTVYTLKEEEVDVAPPVEEEVEAALRVLLPLRPTVEVEVAPKVIGDLITGKITVAVLVNYCRENKLKGHTKMKKKEDLIAFILEQ